MQKIIVREPTLHQAAAGHERTALFLKIFPRARFLDTGPFHIYAFSLENHFRAQVIPQRVFFLSQRGTFLKQLFTGSISMQLIKSGICAMIF